MFIKTYTNGKHRQQGSTLVISMIVLAALMLIGVTAMIASDTQFKLAGNLQFEDSALNNAETALDTAERWLANNGGQTHATTYTGTGIYTDNTIDPLALSWGSGNSIQVGDSSRSYIIQRLSTGSRLQTSSQVIGLQATSACNVVNTYIVTARGTSLRGATKLVQSYYSVLSC